jgi:hypothetical protein
MARVCWLSGLAKDGCSKIGAVAAHYSALNTLSLQMFGVREEVGWETELLKVQILNTTVPARFFAMTHKSSHKAFDPTNFVPGPKLPYMAPATRTGRN